MDLHFHPRQSSRVRVRSLPPYEVELLGFAGGRGLGAARAKRSWRGETWWDGRAGWGEPATRVVRDLALPRPRPPLSESLPRRGRRSSCARNPAPRKLQFAISALHRNGRCAEEISSGNNRSSSFDPSQTSLSLIKFIETFCCNKRDLLHMFFILLHQYI
jgi:hypothetical protein